MGKQGARKGWMGVVVVGVLCFVSGPAWSEERLKPYILANTQFGDMPSVVHQTESSLKANGFQIVGSYSPFPVATVIVVTDPELRTAASKAENGGFGAVERISITNVTGQMQVSYTNPGYFGAAYGLGPLAGVASRLKAALGDTLHFGSEAGLTEKQLAPGTYHYQIGMPYFNQVDVVGKYPDYQTAVATVERSLDAGKGGTKKVYRIDLPNEVSVFGVGIILGDGPNQGAKDTDKEILDIIDVGAYRATSYLPYELMVRGNEIIALRARYRIAVHFPDTSMMGPHGFTKIMSAPMGIRHALEQVAADGH
jgi:hypothetical protein